MKDNILNLESWKNLMEYLARIDNHFFELNVNKDVIQNDKILGNILALQEEVGEFTSEIRKLTRMMFNQKKIDSFRIEDLEDEACDILITLILTLKSCGVENLNAAIERKLAKNKARGY